MQVGSFYPRIHETVSFSKLSIKLILPFPNAIRILLSTFKRLKINMRSPKDLKSRDSHLTNPKLFYTGAQLPIYSVLLLTNILFVPPRSISCSVLAIQGFLCIIKRHLWKIFVIKVFRLHMLNCFINLRLCFFHFFDSANDSVIIYGTLLFSEISHNAIKFLCVFSYIKII